MRIKEITNRYQECGNHFNYLRNRWEDEKRYEDFEDYRKNIIETIHKHYPELKGIKVTKNPFQIIIESPKIKFFFIVGLIKLKLQGEIKKP